MTAGPPPPSPLPDASAGQPDRPAPSRLGAFTRSELADILARFPIGTVHSARPLAVGEAESPKVVVEADAGRYLLKRRPPGSDPIAVALAHQVRLHLAARSFPAPAPVGAGADANTLVQTPGGWIYELTPFIEAGAFDASGEQVRSAGEMLGRLHAELDSLRPSWAPAADTYHAEPGLAARIRGHAEGLGAAARAYADALAERAQDAARRVDLGDPPHAPGLLHGDWHPGNLLFAGSRVAAVVDFDALRLGPRPLDAASGMLQFALPFPRRDPKAWPAALDGASLAQFCIGYHGSQVQAGLAPADFSGAAPWLMVEAMISEGARALALAKTSREAGTSLLEMIHRVTGWIETNADQLASLVASTRAG